MRSYGLPLRCRSARFSLCCSARVAARARAEKFVRFCMVQFMAILECFNRPGLRKKTSLRGRTSRGSGPRCANVCQSFLAFDPGKFRGAARRNAYRRQAVHRNAVDEPAGELSDHGLMGPYGAGYWSAGLSANRGHGERHSDSCKQCVCNADMLSGKCAHFLLRLNLVSR